MRGRPYILAAVGGALAATSAPPFEFAYIAELGIGFLLLAIRGVGARRAAAAGGLWGIVYFAILLHWTHRFGYIALVALVLSQSAFVAAFATVAAVSWWGSNKWGSRYRPASNATAIAVFQVAALWGVFEIARARLPIGGFGWGGLGYSHGSNYVAEGLAPIGGVHLVSVWIVAVAASAITIGVRMNLRIKFATTSGMLIGLLALPAFALALPTGVAHPDSLDVAVVQGNVPDKPIGFQRRGREGPEDRVIVESHLRLTQELVGTTPDLVVWPENAFDRDPRSVPDQHEALLQAVDDVGSPFLVGVIRSAPDATQRNSSLLIEPGKGITDFYDKRHLVPFGEYVPMPFLRDWIPALRDQLPSDLVSGRGSGVLEVERDAGPAVLVGVAICFESTFVRDVQRSISNGAQMILVSTNNASYGRSPASRQHVLISRMRALEHRRTVVQAAISGISALIEPDGTIRQETNLFESVIMRGGVRLASGKTFFARTADLGLVVFILLASLPFYRGRQRA